MDIFEKQQAIESIRTVIRARWFIGSAVFIQGLIIKYFFKSAVPLAGTSVLTFIVLGYFAGNLFFWLYLRRPAEKLGEGAIKSLKFLQVPLDQMTITAVIYFSGTVNKLIILLYPMTLIIASSIYRRRGVFLATFWAILILSGLTVLEYMGIMRPQGTVESPFTRFVAGDRIWMRGQLVGYITYLLGSAFMASSIADLFRMREKRLELQKRELTEKTELMTHRSEELTQTKNWLHEALTKSDKTRTELASAKEQLEKANQELKAKIDELEKFSKATVGREIKMMELKGEIETLKSTVGNLKTQSGKSQ
ncbi:MAG: hypothetical protein V1845_01350 [bacterium]